MAHEELIKAIEEMSVLELSELVKALEDKFGRRLRRQQLRRRPSLT